MAHCADGTDLRPGVGSPGHGFVELLWSNIKKPCQCFITPDWFLPEQYRYILWAAFIYILTNPSFISSKSSVPPVTKLNRFYQVKFMSQWDDFCHIGFTCVLCFFHFNMWAQQSTALRDFIISNVIQLMPMNHLFDLVILMLNLIRTVINTETILAHHVVCWWTMQ